MPIMTIWHFSLFFIAIALLKSETISGQDQVTLHIKRAKGKIEVDARDSERDWEDADIAGDFRQYFPFDTSAAVAPTEVRLTYDDENLYVFGRMYNKGARKYVTPSLRRDFRGEANDGIVVVLDTYKDGINAFSFGVNPFGVQREGLISSGGTSSDNLSLDWDNKWFTAAAIHGEYWVCEMAIPFNSIRYKENTDQWNINFYRIDSEYTERSTWAPIPRSQSIFNLAWMRTLQWDQPLKKSGPNISLIPYIAPSASRDFLSGNPSRKELPIGGDAKIGISSALNLDLTINPNFAQVEVDQQVTNLDRFELFFPEKRQFFLENADLFSGYGTSGAQPFFSRRIGITRDKATGQNINNPIYGGARLSGKINNNLRVGLLSMQAAPDEKNNLPSFNYSMLSVQQKLFARSNISAFIVNKQAIAGEDQPGINRFNSVSGIDYNLGSKDGRFSGKAYYHQSFSPVKTDSAYSSGVRLDFNSPRMEFSVLARTVGANYNPEVGFVRRKRFNQLAPELLFYSYPKSRIVNKHGPGTDVDIIWNDLYGVTDWDANIWYNIRFQNTANFFIRVRQDFVYLFSPFDPTNTGGLELPAGKGYRWFNVVYNYQSNFRKKIFFSVNGRIGQYYNGERQSAAGAISYRLQPVAVFTMDFSYNRIRLPKPYNSADLVLIGPKVDITFSRKLFWTTYVQYNSQISNLNINTRLQWRFKPVSDLYLVYTDNYFSDFDFRGDGFPYFQGNIGQPKLRALSIKLSYWLNL
jgi:hypothetical protein